MTLIEEAESVRKKSVSKHAPGSIDRIFEYNEKCSRDESGMLHIIVKPELVESKKKKSIN
jgi:hypothetical protein